MYLRMKIGWWKKKINSLSLVSHINQSQSSGTCHSRSHSEHANFSSSHASILRRIKRTKSPKNNFSTKWKRATETKVEFNHEICVSYESCSFFHSQLTSQDPFNLRNKNEDDNIIIVLNLYSNTKVYI